MTQPLHVVSQTSLVELQTCPAAHVDVPGSQRSADSLQVSVPLQATASAQARGTPPPQTAPAEQVSPTVQYRESSQAPAVRGDQPARVSAGVQLWHWFIGLLVPVA